MAALDTYMHIRRSLTELQVDDTATAILKKKKKPNSLM